MKRDPWSWSLVARRFARSSPLCAAVAAQDKGSARQGIRYLYKAGELGANQNQETVARDLVRETEDIIERKNIEKGIRDLTTQDHLALAGVVSLEVAGETPSRTREVYAEYKNITTELAVDPIAMRRVRDRGDRAGGGEREDPIVAGFGVGRGPVAIVLERSSTT